MDLTSVGQKLKKLYPAYAQYPDEVVGQKYYLKYGDKGLQALGVEPPQKTPEPTKLSAENQQLQTALLNDVLAGKPFYELYPEYTKAGIKGPIIKQAYNEGPLAKKEGPAKETFEELEASTAKVKTPTEGQEKLADTATVANIDLGKLQAILDSKEGKKAKNLWRLGDVGKFIGQAPTQLYSNAAKNVYDAVMRTRTGAALNKDEESFYQDFIPYWVDGKESTADKMERLKQIFELSMIEGQLTDEELKKRLNQISGTKINSGPTSSFKPD